MILGLLVGIVNQPIRDTSPPIYECAVLWPSIHHVMAQNRNSVMSLDVIQPLKQKVTVPLAGLQCAQIEASQNSPQSVDNGFPPYFAL